MIGSMIPIAFTFAASSVISCLVKRARRRSCVRVVEGASSTRRRILKASWVNAALAAGAFICVLLKKPWWICGRRENPAARQASRGARGCGGVLGAGGGG